VALFHYYLRIKNTRYTQGKDMIFPTSLWYGADEKFNKEKLQQVLKVKHSY